MQGHLPLFLDWHLCQQKILPSSLSWIQRCIATRAKPETSLWDGDASFILNGTFAEQLLSADVLRVVSVLDRQPRRARLIVEIGASL
jgi:hypothetical protein